ncbi:Nuclear receptor domain-containing protein [Aphelenchoides fujianensis]|nr:Nuclear receptor domain-containing protein [Aphelenchoides fujianensis]
MSINGEAPGSVESMDSTPSTSNDSAHGGSSTAVHSPSNVESCPICGDSAWNKHFGVISCNACAAFFRRTVALRKSYVCVRGKNCDVTQDSARHLCKFCRFKLCIQHGMCIGAVFTRPPQNDFNVFEETALLRKLLECRNAVFVDRFNATIKVNGGRQESVQLGRRQPAAAHMVRAVQAEFIVMTALSFRFCRAVVNAAVKLHKARLDDTDLQDGVQPDDSRASGHRHHHGSLLNTSSSWALL